VRRISHRRSATGISSESGNGAAGAGTLVHSGNEGATGTRGVHSTCSSTSENLAGGTASRIGMERSASRVAKYNVRGGGSRNTTASIAGRDGGAPSTDATNSISGQSTSYSGIDSSDTGHISTSAGQGVDASNRKSRVGPSTMSISEGGAGNSHTGGQGRGPYTRGLTCDGMRCRGRREGVSRITHQSSN